MYSLDNGMQQLQMMNIADLFNPASRMNQNIGIQIALESNLQGKIKK